MASAILDNLDGLSTDLTKEYRPGTKAEGLEGKFVLKVEQVEGWALENVKSLKSSLSNAKTERDQARAIVRELGDDFTAEQYRKAMKELEDLKKGTGDDKVKAQIETVKTQLADKHGKELKVKDDLLAQRDREVEELLIDSEATRALNEAKGNATLLLPHVKAKCKVVRDAKGKPRAVIVGDDGVTPLLSMKQGSQDNMSIGEFVESLRTNNTYAPAFGGSGATGSAGADNTNAGRGNSNGTGASGAGGAGSGNGTGTGGQGQGKTAMDKLREHRRAEFAKGKTT